MTARERTTENFTRAIVEQHQAGLSHDHVAVLLAYFDNCCNYEETAEAIKVPIGTVKSRLNRAREKLAVLVEEADTERRAKHEMQPGGLLADESGGEDA